MTECYHYLHITMNLQRTKKILVLKFSFQCLYDSAFSIFQIKLAFLNPDRIQYHAF